MANKHGASNERNDPVFPIVPDAGRQIQIHPEQQRMNQYILAEVAKLKRDNKRLNDEVLSLRMENMQLANRISSMPAYGLPIEYPSGSDNLLSGSFGPVGAVTTKLNGGSQELPFVEFDMRKQPPTVQSANVMFCSLLGYTTEEVLGKPWQYFIQDEYVERTIRMLQRESGSNQMAFGQVYKDRHGRPVPAQDLHTFNRDEKGRVITDYVIVRPEGTAQAGSSAQLPYFAGLPQQPFGVRPVPSIMGGGGGDGTGLQMMDESGDEPFGRSPSPSPSFGISPPPPITSASGEWNLAPFMPMWEPDK